MKKVLVAIASSGLLLAGGSVVKPIVIPTITTVMPYSAYIKYGGGTTKNHGFVAGLYTSVKKGLNKAELNLEHTKIYYNSSSTRSKLDQSDLTFIYTRYQGYNLLYKAGFHYIASGDTQTDNGKVFMLGASYYKYLKYNVGANLYYSDYHNSTPSLHIWQLNPHAGYNFGNYYSSIGSFYLQADYNYIHINNATSHSLNNNYHSFGLSLSNYNGPWTTTISGWIGKRVYMVDNGGFTVYNLGEEYKAGIKLSTQYAISSKSSIKAQYEYSKFKDVSNAHSNTFLLSYTHTF